MSRGLQYRGESVCSQRQKKPSKPNPFLRRKARAYTGDRVNPFFQLAAKLQNRGKQVKNKDHFEDCKKEGAALLQTELGFSSDYVNYMPSIKAQVTQMYQKIDYPDPEISCERLGMKRCFPDH